MCNQLHDDFEPIPESGEGWKFFIKDVIGNLMSLVNRDDYSQIDKNKKIIWDGGLYITEEDNDKTGFCFFNEMPTNFIINLIHNTFKPPRFARKWVVLKRIKYYKGLGKVKETKFIRGYQFNMCLCKEFEILKD